MFEELRLTPVDEEKITYINYNIGWMTTQYNNSYIP